MLDVQAYLSGATTRFGSSSYIFKTYSHAEFFTTSLHGLTLKCLANFYVVSYLELLDCLPVLNSIRVSALVAESFASRRKASLC